LQEADARYEANKHILAGIQKGENYKREPKDANVIANTPPGITL
jgi:hypothetical protein